MKLLPILDETQVKRLYRYFTPADPSVCWNWTGAKGSVGHPVMNIKGRTTYVHRLIYFYLKDSKFDQSLCVCHKCDNPSCVNPDHLFLGTHQDNMKDKIAKGRDANGNVAMAKLSDQEIQQIKDEYRTSGNTQRSIARRYKIHQGQVSKIVNGLRWRHLFKEVGT